MNNSLNFAKVVLLSLLVLVVIDLALGFIVGRDYTPKASSLKNYFNYGVSTQQKVKVVIADNDTQADQIATIGWNTTLPERIPAKKPGCSYNVTVYGMSFSNRISAAAQNLDPCMSLRRISGPGAPLSHSYYMFSKFNNADNADIVILGILASSLPFVNSTAHFSPAFEAPGAHMYSRYQVNDQELIEAIPPAADLNSFRKLIHQDEAALLAYLQKNDDFYHPFIFSHSWADYSLSLRMLRRAYGQSFKRKVIANYYQQQTGFNNHNGMLDTTRAIIQHFYLAAEAKRQQAIVLLINDRDYADSLDNALGEFMDNNQLPYVTTRNIVDSRDMSNFVSDGHFISELDALIAQSLITTIQKLKD